ncbi:hypothetical protein C5167_006345 [Papaver somniferum]|uniref:F-box domain-containing protein n=1 Tax=Papaver somniferum TaxID=3469 RepID=A0A4Y7JGW2_PAPSO|nr:F-box protein At4g00755-like [Papaver somniferum]RZC59038.1 hypothetical protein C5167_006345 [Papaver somniferum]
MAGGCIDFVQLLNQDLSTNILSYLDDPADVVRVGSVSRAWRQFVISNGLSKNLCLRLLPEVSHAVPAIEENDIVEPLDVKSTDDMEVEKSTADMEVEKLKKNHRVYAFLAKGLASSVGNCISEVICASSTDNYPEESILNTLEPRDRISDKACYWSSEGESDQGVPETLTYKLTSDLCFINEINIQPFEAYFQYGSPIYSAKAVRFRIGHFTDHYTETDLVDVFEVGHRHIEDDVVWTYTSEYFPMAQENCLQKFKLPQPVFAVGGVLQIELSGRVQQQDVDGLYYVCISHVQILGRSLKEDFDAEFVDFSGKCVLKYIPKPDATGDSNPSAGDVLEDGSGGSTPGPSRLHSFTAGLVQRAGMGFERIFSLRGHGVLIMDDDSNDEDNEDYEDGMNDNLVEAESDAEQAFE